MAQHPAVRQVLATAAAEIGYSRWKDSQRGTKYARQTQPVFWPRDLWLLANGISFCDLFVTWVFWQALGEDFVTDGGLPAGASYNTDYRASKGGRVSKSRAQPGDVLVFDWNWNTLSTNHVGILEKNLSSGNYQTIEGNTSPGTSGSQGNGGGVYRRVRRPDQVRYVIRPNWSKAGAVSRPPSNETGSAGKPWATSPRVQGMTEAEVRAIQGTLAGFDLDLGSYGADGSYGDDTGRAVQQLQRELHITPTDGIYGPGTEKAVATIKKQIEQIHDYVVERAYLDTKLSEVKAEAKRAADIATVNQREIRETRDRVGPIYRGGKPIALRQEVADVKTTLLGEDLPAIVRDAVADAGVQDPEALAAQIAKRLADGLTLTVSATANDGTEG